jgi:chromo domain-containing protein 1
LGRNCEFAHYDTGHYAGKPGTFRETLQKEALQRRQSGLSDATATNANLTALGSRDKRVALPETSQLVGAPVTSSDQVVRSPFSDAAPQAMMLPSAQHGRPDKIASTSSTIPTGPQVRRSSSISVPSVEATIRVTLENDTQTIVLNVRLEIADPDLHQRLQSLPAVTLKVKCAVMASDFQSVVWTKNTNASQNGGRIVVGADHATSAQSIAELCKLTSSGLLAALDDHEPRFVIYPSTAEEWRFLTPAESQSGAPESALLRFKMLSKIPGVDQYLAAGPTPHRSKPQKPMEGVGAALLGLDVDRLLLREDGSRLDAVFLMLPGSRHLELEVLSRYFREQSCNVYHSGTPGAWLYFMKTYGRACLIVIHPEVRLESIPRLYDFTFRTGSRSRFFSIGINSDTALTQQERPAFACTRLFPSGQAIHLTDEALQYYPNNCREIIKLIKQKNDQTLAPSKIITRPNVKAWLLDLIGSTQDIRYVELYEAFCILCPLEDHDPEDMAQTLPTSSLLMIDGSTLPRLAGMDEPARSNYLVNWFAGWAVRHASIWRTFVICYEPRTGSTRTVLGKGGANVVETNSDPFGWAKQYQNVGVVSPSKVHERLAEKLPKT